MSSPPSPLPLFASGVALVFLLLPLLLISCGCIFLAADAAALPRYNSIISFGDSLADTGNLVLSEAAAFPFEGKLPYGMTYFGHATGRCSDGRLVVDFIAEALGLPYLPPYLGGGDAQGFRRGVNFAVGGATALDAAFFRDRGMATRTNYSLSVQLRWFQELRPSLCGSPTECRDYFRRSLFLVGEIGGNDYNYPFLARRTLSEVTSYVPLVVEAIASATEKLIQQGAVELLVPGNLALGCNPIYLTIGASPNQTNYDPRNGCLLSFNSFAQYHNALLKRALDDLQKKYPTTRIAYADYYGPTLRFANFPEAFGFSNGALTKCCAEDGNFWADCGAPGTRVHGDPSTFVNWDGAHMTEAAYRNLAAAVTKQLQAPHSDIRPTRRFSSSVAMGPQWTAPQDATMVQLPDTLLNQMESYDY